MSEKHKIIDLKNDLLFKFTFGKEDAISKKLLKIIIEGALSIQVKELTIMNPDLSPSHITDRDLILDIKVKDEKGNMIDVEMQCYGPSERFYRRFAQYGHKLASELHKEGDQYYLEEKKAYQILFIDGLNPKSTGLIRKVKMKDDDGDVDEADPLERTYVYIKEMKEYDSSNLFKSLVYLFNYPESCDKLKTGNEMIQMLADKINEFNEDEELADLAYRRRLDQMFLNSLEKEVELAREAKDDLKTAKEQIEAAKEQIEAAKEQAEVAKEQGMKIGETKVNLLNQKLIESNRIEDLKESSINPAFQQALFKEFNLD